MYWLAPVFATLVAIGSIGVYLNFGNPDWKRVGLNQWEIRQNIGQFPDKYCPPETLPVCRALSRGLLKFLGL